jgi:hypothetical protein
MHLLCLVSGDHQWNGGGRIPYERRGAVGRVFGYLLLAVAIAEAPGGLAARRALTMTIYSDDGSGNVKKLHKLTGEQRVSVRRALGGRCGAGADEEALEQAIERYEEGDYNFDTAILEQSVQNLDFNVMPDKDVCEKFNVKGYFVGSDVARAVFDREYVSAMERSPSHVIFMSALVQFQKLVYVLLCRRSGVEYKPDGHELYKVWPTSIDIRMPVLVCETENLIQDVFLSRREPAGVNGWVIEGFSLVNYKIGFIGRAVVYRTPQQRAATAERTEQVSTFSAPSRVGSV